MMRRFLKICLYLWVKRQRSMCPHHVTENAYLERLDPKELEEIKQDLVYHLIRKRCFEDARYKKKWLVIVDGTQLYCGRRKLNEHCLERLQQ